MSEGPNHGRTADGGIWAGFCANVDCNILGCPGDCTPPNPLAAARAYLARLAEKNAAQGLRMAELEQQVDSNLPALIAKWVEAAEQMERDMRDRSDLTELGRSALLHQAIGMRGCAEELRWALGRPANGEWPV